MERVNAEPGRRLVLNDPTEFCAAIGLKPYPWVVSILESTNRNTLLAGGWRVGKSTTAAAYLSQHAIQHGGHYWIVSKSYDLTRPEFEYAADFLRRLGENPTVNVPIAGPWTLRLGRHDNPNWLFIQTRSADDPQKLEAANLDGVVLAEAAQLNQHVIVRVMGRVMQKRGWVFASGSFEQNEASPWFRETYGLGLADNEKGWRTYSAPSWYNTEIFPGGEDDPKIREAKVNMPLNIYREKICAVPQKPVDLVFVEFEPRIHMATHVQRKGPVEIAVDFGYGAHYAVLAMQEDDGFVKVIDEFYEQGVVTHDVILQLKKRTWWNWVTGGVMDVAGHQHQGDRSQFELWQQLTGMRLRSRKIAPLYGIQRLQTFLIDPGSGKSRISFSTRCHGLVSEFNNYKWRILDGAKVGREPINRYNHALNALWYYLIDRFGYNEGVQRAETEYRPSPYRRR